MTDVRDLLTSTTPEPAGLAPVDLDALSARGRRRRLAKRAGAGVLSLALLVGAATVATDAVRGPDAPTIGEVPGARGWESLPEPPLPTRSSPQVLHVDDGRLVVAGGHVGDDADGIIFRTDGAVLDADRLTWTPLPDVPFADGSFDQTGRIAVFSLHGRTLWAHAPDGPATAPSAPLDLGELRFDLARLDLDDLDAGWEVLPPPPVAGTLQPFVSVVDDTVVVLEGTDLGSAFRSRSGLRTSGAVWRDGTWTTFEPAPLPPVSAPFVGLDRDHLAVVGGHGPDGPSADAAVLDLATATWSVAPDLPLEARGWLVDDVHTLVADGRMLVAGGVVRPTPWLSDVGAPLEELVSPICAQSSDPEPCEVPVLGELPSPEGPPEIASGPADLAAGVAWLDLDTLEWEVVDPDLETIHTPLRPDHLTPPHSLSLSGAELLTGTDAEDDGGPVRVLGDGTIVPGPLPDAGIGAQSLTYVGGTPVLALGPGPSDGGARVAVRSGDGWGEVTPPSAPAGVTYALAGTDLVAAGGAPDADAADVLEVRLLRR